MGTLVAKPADQRVPLSPEAARYIQRGSLCIVGDPVQISPTVEEVFRRPALSTGAGMPEGLRELAGFHGRPPGNRLFEPERIARRPRRAQLIPPSPAPLPSTPHHPTNLPHPRLTAVRHP